MAADPDSETTPLLKDSTRVSVYAANEDGEERVRDGDEPQVQPQDEVESGQELKPKVSMAAVMIPMSIGIFLSAMDGTIIASSYAVIGSELKQLQNTSWIATGYMLTLTSFQPLYGKLKQETDHMTLRIPAGIANMVFATGQAVGAPLGGYLADTIGWRWAFGLQVPLALLAIVSVSLALKLPQVDHQNFKQKLRRVDFGGAFTLVSSIFCLLLGLDRGGNVGWGDRITIASLSTFVGLFVAFLIMELYIASEPFAPKRIVVNPSLVASYLANFFSVGAGMAQVFMITMYFQAVQGRSASEAGIVLLPSIITAVLGSLLSGIIMQTSGKYYWMTVGVFTLMLVGHITVPLFAGVWKYSYVGITIGAVSHLLSHMSIPDPDWRGAYLGLCLSSFGVGAGITTTLIALIANAGPVDQAVATAGMSRRVAFSASFLSLTADLLVHGAVSYLFRSLGSVVCLSLGTTLMQDTLRHILYERLSGGDVAEIIRRVRESLAYIGELEPSVRATVIDAYADSVHVAQWFTAGLTVCALIASFFIKETQLTK
ncbi:hypothetical protein EIP86_005156 [Pleurotus ostreatoroseus]|nr:hypothetical protein EIP86_005156 [Pleurotus ostreatoroseus]